MKLFQPEKEKMEDQITFVHTYNPGHRFERGTIRECLKQSNHFRILNVFEKKSGYGNQTTKESQIDFNQIKI